jgi:adenylate cyclase
MRAVRRNSKRQRVRLLPLVVLGALGVGALAQETDVLRRVELNTVDMRFDLRGERVPPPDVVVVGVDDVTFDRLGLQWPLPRSRHGRVIDRLHKAGAAVIAYDIQFTEQTKPAEDGALLESVFNADGRVLLATTETDARGRTKVLGGPETQRMVKAQVGNALMPADEGGVRRRVVHEVGNLKTFAVRAAEMKLGREVTADQFGEDGEWIDFHGPARTLAFHSFSDVLQGRVPAEAFRGKVVVVGAVAPSLQDVAATSASGSGLVSGPEIQAEAISTILRGFPLRDSAAFVPYLLLVGFALLPGLLMIRARPPLALTLSLASGALYLTGAYLAFREGVVLPVVVPMVTLAISALGTFLVGFLIEAFERARVRDFFAHFVPEGVVAEVLKKTDRNLTLGGTGRECTVLFSDLRGFTSFSEGKPPAQVIEILNGYLGEMTDAILDEGGTLISFMGDGIMAIFGAPLDQPDHRDRALAAAHEMLRRLDTFNASMMQEGLPGDFKMGIGINTGPVMCGNVGSSRRLEYTAIGDTVNTASRLEGMTKDTGRAIHVSEACYEGLNGAATALHYIGEFEVRGRSSKIKLWGYGELDSGRTATSTSSNSLASSSVSGEPPRSSQPA